MVWGTSLEIIETHDSNSEEVWELACRYSGQAGTAYVAKFGNNASETVKNGSQDHTLFHYNGWQSRLLLLSHQDCLTAKRPGYADSEGSLTGNFHKAERQRR